MLKLNRTNRGECMSEETSMFNVQELKEELIKHIKNFNSFGKTTRKS